MRPGLKLPLGRFLAVPASEGSLARITACVRLSLDYFRRTEQERSPDRLALNRLGDVLADPTRRLYLLEDGGEDPAGLLDLALDTPEPGAVTLALLVLARTRRGRGEGREIAEAAFDLLARAGYRRLHLGVAPGEDQAARFWVAVGLWERGEEDGVRLFERPLGADPQDEASPPDARCAMEWPPCARRSRSSSRPRSPS